MSTPAKVAGFVAALAAVFVAALGVGNAVGPVADPAPSHDDAHEAGDAPAGNGHGEHASPAAAPPGSELPGGLAVSQNGYTLQLTDDRLAAGPGARVALRVVGPDGHAVTSFDVVHEQRLHLIAVRRDLTGYQHVHPVLAGDGTWTTELDLTPGHWRLFADFTATGDDSLTLGADLAVAGRYEPAADPSQEVRTARVDGYDVALAGDLAPGASSPLTVSVSRDGRPVDDLQPYLGSFGHLVALRAGDLAYLHVHPVTEATGQERGGPDVAFEVATPTAGRYHLFVDFQHDGVVRTAAFVVDAGADGPHATDEADGGHDHE